MAQRDFSSNKTQHKQEHQQNKKRAEAEIIHWSLSWWSWYVLAPLVKCPPVIRIMKGRAQTAQTITKVIKYKKHTKYVLHKYK